MKFKLVEDKQLLTEKDWYEVSDKIGNNYYVYATNPNQALDTYNSALGGYYRGQNGEQSFDRQIADTIKNNKSGVVNVTRYAGVPTTNILSRTDRELRRQAHITAMNSIYSALLSMTPNLAYISQQQFEKLKDNVANDSVYIHHVNRNEYDNNVNNLVFIEYNNKNDLPFAHAIHNVIHTNSPANVVPLSRTFDVIDCSSGTPVYHTATITIR